MGDIDTPSYFRDLKLAADLKIQSLEIKCGNQKLQDTPITTKGELYQYLKAYYNQQQDTDIGSLITNYNWDTEVPSLSEAQNDIATTRAKLEAEQKALDLKGKLAQKKIKKFANTMKKQTINNSLKP